MHSSVTRVLAVGSPHGLPQGHALAVATLVSWLATEAFGGFMLTSWLGSGGSRVNRDAPGAVPRSVVFGHAGLAFTGFVWWFSFVLTRDAPLAWLSIGFLAPAIGLGISTLTLWTPYPTRRHAGAEPAWQHYDGMVGMTSDELLVAALEDDALTTKLVDELVASVLDQPEPTRRSKWQLTPLIPAAHGVLALSTMLFAVLAAVSSS